MGFHLTSAVVLSTGYLNRTRGRYLSTGYLNCNRRCYLSTVYLDSNRRQDMSTGYLNRYHRRYRKFYVNGKLEVIVTGLQYGINAGIS